MNDQLKKLLELNAKEVDREIEKLLPKTFDVNWFNNLFGKTKWEYDCEACTKSIARPIWELLNRGGKRWRPLLMLLCYNAVTKNSDNNLIIKKFLPFVEIIHNGTLMIDDIEDDSKLRRGKECIHKIFGIDVAINAGNAMYYLPYSIIKNSNLKQKIKLLIHELIAEEMTKLAFGQATDIYWHNNIYDVTENQYLQMCAYKTGTLARISAKLGAILGDGNREQIDALGKFAESIGVAFQIQDDILNITNTKWGKDFGEDITEGKKSLIIIKTLNKANEKDKKRLLEILNLKTKDKELIREAIKIIDKYCAIEYSKKVAEDIVSKAWKELEKIISYSDSKNKLKLFTDFLVNRKI